MVKLFKHTFALFSTRQNNIISAASVIMVTVALSRILGLFRDRLLAARFTPSELGVYYAAFRLPNMIFELLVMGALSTAFIPVFTTYLETKEKKLAFRMASSVMNIGVLFFAIGSIPLVIFSKQVSYVLAPGFDKNQIVLMASFTQIMIVAQVFPLIIGNFLTGMLQSFRNFLLPSIAPVVYNLGIIAGIIFLSPVIGLYAPVMGVVIGAILFVLVQIPVMMSLGYRHSWCFSFHDPGTRQVGKLMLPRTLGLAVSQIDTTVDLILSTLIGASAVTTFNFAQHLQQVPIGLFGASIAQATLPTLSSCFAKKNVDEFKKIFLSSFHQILFLVIPLSAIFIVLRIPIVRLVFGASTLFDWGSTVETGQALAFFSISLFAQSGVHLLARSFYALHDTRTPVYIGGISVVINVVFSVLFVVFMHMGVWTLGLSTSISSIVNMVLLLYYLDKKVGGFDRYHLYFPAIKIVLSGLVTGVALYIPLKLLDQLVFDTTKTFNLLLLTGTSTITGLLVYFFLAWFLNVPQIALVFKLFSKAKNRQNVFIDTPSEMVNEQQEM
jgi:putative peptidoglycan lipid II flippase